MPDFAVIIALIFFLYGCCIGSFLNVCIYRIPRRLSVADGRSFCPGCHHVLQMPEMIPVVSFIVLKGRCRYCQEPITIYHPLVESFTGIFFVLCYLNFGLCAKTFILCGFGCLLVIAAGIDLYHTYVPDRIPLLISFLAVIFHLSGQAPSLHSCIFGSLLVAGFMLCLSLATNGGIGGGDIKLFAAVGLLLGFSNTILAFFAGYILAAIYCVPLLFRKKIRLGHELPMVPFFACSIIIAALWGEQILAWYLMIFI